MWAIGIKYFEQGKHYINIIAIILYLFTSTILFIDDEKESTSVTLYNLTLLAGTVKVYFNMNALDFMRDLSSSLQKIFYDCRWFAFMCAIFILSFANIFYVTNFYKQANCAESCPETAGCDKDGPVWYLWYTYDQFFGNWNWGSPPKEDILWPITFIFVVYVFIFPVVLVNLLVSLVTGSYEEHMENLLSDDNKRKIQLIIDV